MSKEDIKIIYEDEDVLALNKPAGLVVHSDGKAKEPTLVDWVIKNYPEIKGVGEPMELSDGATIDRPGIVHRLDRETSGVILVAKNQETFLFLKRQFQDREIRKVYRAIVHGVFKEERGTIDKSIGRSKKDFRRWSTGSDVRGTAREAVTEYKVLCGSKEYSYIEIYPKTGRTHQIRVHMKAIQRPIVCDRLYSPKNECSVGMERVALHSLSINFSLRGGVNIKAESPIPEDFNTALGQIGCEA